MTMPGTWSLRIAWPPTGQDRPSRRSLPISASRTSRCSSPCRSTLTLSGG